tara:strand:- start:2459 stop:2707 length:249 start_codon:yes stop_codon:yes gene_type:complete
MVWIFIFFITLLSVGVIAYPLFYGKLQRYKLPESAAQNHIKANFWLSALSDLEHDHKLGRVDLNDYQIQKNFLQRNYLDSIK